LTRAQVPHLLVPPLVPGDDHGMDRQLFVSTLHRSAVVARSRLPESSGDRFALSFSIHGGLLTQLSTCACAIFDSGAPADLPAEINSDCLGVEPGSWSLRALECWGLRITRAHPVTRAPWLAGQGYSDDVQFQVILQIVQLNFKLARSKLSSLRFMAVAEGERFRQPLNGHTFPLPVTVHCAGLPVFPTP
jgi:hypothetical protein